MRVGKVPIELSQARGGNWGGNAFTVICSNPPSSTNTLKANPNRLAFFCLLPRVCAGSCGFLRTTERAISASSRRVLLSVCVFSLRPAPPSAGRSPEGSPVTPI